MLSCIASSSLLLASWLVLTAAAAAAAATAAAGSTLLLLLHYNARGKRWQNGSTFIRAAPPFLQNVNPVQPSRTNERTDGPAEIETITAAAARNNASVCACSLYRVPLLFFDLFAHSLVLDDIVVQLRNERPLLIFLDCLKHFLFSTARVT